MRADVSSRGSEKASLGREDEESYCKVGRSIQGCQEQELHVLVAQSDSL